MRLITSESVTEGHPDKLCDQISDRILDAVLELDPKARVAIETVATTGLIHVMGELTTDSYVDIAELAREVVCSVGYNSEKASFDGRSCGVVLSIDNQSPEIRDAVNTSYEIREEHSEDPLDKQGAGDQGIVFGYASNETPQLMPLPIMLAHSLAERLTEVRKTSVLNYLLPDGKTQVTVKYDDNNQPTAVDTVVLSTQHHSEIELEKLRRDVTREVIAPVIEKFGFPLTEETKLFVNPTGKFVIGGPMGDVGLTGRKIIIDTYGGASRHGGGAFSGKDPSKVDRSAAYALRWVAKNVVAAGLADRIEVQVAYAIGKASPVGIFVDTFGTANIPEDQIVDAITQVFDLRPLAIIADLDLLKPRYSQTAVYGHFGRELETFTWEALNRVDELRQIAGLNKK